MHGCALQECLWRGISLLDLRATAVYTLYTLWGTFYFYFKNSNILLVITEPSSVNPSYLHSSKPARKFLRRAKFFCVSRREPRSSLTTSPVILLDGVVGICKPVKSGQEPAFESGTVQDLEPQVSQLYPLPNRVKNQKHVQCLQDLNKIASRNWNPEFKMCHVHFEPNPCSYVLLKSMTIAVIPIRQPMNGETKTLIHRIHSGTIGELMRTVYLQTRA